MCSIRAKGAALDLSLPKKQDWVDSPPSAHYSADSVDAELGPSEESDLYKRACDHRVLNRNGYNEVDDSPPTSRRRQSDSPTSERRPSDSPTQEHHVLPDTQSCPRAGLLSEAECSDLDGHAITRSNGGITIGLHDASLWNSFRKLGTEMIINRGGRRMFPHVILSVSGLNPSATYSIFLDIVPADERRFKYINEQWMGMGIADPSPGTRMVVHSDSPNLGSFWMQTRISFSKVRLTNNKDSSEDNILLLSMHKYKVVIKIRNESIPFDNMLSFSFDESAFLAVTAYQNNKITQLKIQNNPFAKAFRDAPHKQNLGDGKRKHGGDQMTCGTNDYAAFKVSSHKKPQLSHKDKSEPHPGIPRWDPWYMSAMGPTMGLGHMPRLLDYPAVRFDAFRHPGMFTNAALMAQWPYFPFFPAMGNPLAQTQQSKDKSSNPKDHNEPTWLPSSPEDEDTKDKGSSDDRPKEVRVN